MAFEMYYYTSEVYQMSLGKLRQSFQKRLVKIDYILWRAVKIAAREIWKRERKIKSFYGGRDYVSHDDVLE